MNSGLEAPTGASHLVVRNAELDGTLVDFVVDDGVITAITPARPENSSSRGRELQFAEGVLDAGGGAVLPGLHDHHVHVLAMAAAAGSVPVGPGDVHDAAGFAAAMCDADVRLPAGRWIRAVGYHESVAGELDRHVLDQLGIRRPIRVQHRTGALWVLNSAAIGALGIDGRESSVVETGAHGVPTGRLYRADAWLRDRIPRQPLDLAGVGHAMAAYGITGVTDLTPTSNPAELAVLSAALARGDLRCRLTVTGAPSLPATAAPELPRGPVKLVIDDHQLPGLDWLLRQFAAARTLGRPVAVHCVTLPAL
ncbi:MAG: amidohydrolase family protein, partial [Actinomycetota bacterium]|nr:amidohydrolase family protein [Actinomycetota bacterium]